jgi:hypothetical protein
MRIVIAGGHGKKALHLANSLAVQASARAQPRCGAGVPSGISRCLGGVPVRTRPVRPVLPHAFFAPRRSPSDRGGRAHAYELAWNAPGGDGIFGACYFLDVPLAFGVFDGFGHVLIPEPTPDAGALSARIRTAWTAFRGYR